MNALTQGLKQISKETAQLQELQAYDLWVKFVVLLFENDTISYQHAAEYLGVERKNFLKLLKEKNITLNEEVEIFIMEYENIQEISKTFHDNH